MKTISIAWLVAAGVIQANPVYQLHEWGTFTTVSGSNGVLLDGLEREEETLPAFVHSHIGLENGQQPDPAEIERIFKTHGTVGISSPLSKGLGRRPLAHVTVKMETPVIYFHSEESAPFAVKVNVGFEGGTISQWYPQRSAGEKLPEPPAPGDPVNHPTPVSAWLLDFAKPYHGSIEWQADVLPRTATEELSLFKPGDNIGWLRARQPVTNAVKTSSGETDGYLFYRGVGNFTPGLLTTVASDETLHLTNQTIGRIPFAVVVERSGGTLRWNELTQGLDTKGEIAIAETALHNEADPNAKALYLSMAKGLEACGLTRLEARAMVETWWHSYFEAEGLRVFWVLPRETTDKLLPLQVSPAPSDIVRVIVGRSEILRPKREAELLAASGKTGDEAWVWQSALADRFGLAIQKRVASLKVQ